MHGTNQYTLNHLLHQSRRIGKITTLDFEKETNPTILPLGLNKKHLHKRNFIQQRATKFIVHKPLRQNSTYDLNQTAKIQGTQQIYDSTTSKLKTSIYFKINPILITQKFDALKIKCINYFSIKAS
jgi:hypothetical protein